MGLIISAFTGIQYLGKQVEIIQYEAHYDIVMYEGEPTKNFLQIDHAGYPMHAGVLVDGGYYYYSDEMRVEISYSDYGKFIDYAEDFFNKQRISNPLIMLTDFTDCDGVISNKMCVKIYDALLYAESEHDFTYPNQFFKLLMRTFYRAITKNGIVVYW